MELYVFVFTTWCCHWGKRSYQPLEWILYYFGSVIAKATKKSCAEFLQSSHKPVLFTLTSTTPSHMALRPSHTCAKSPREYLRRGYLWLRTAIRNVIDNSVLLQTLHSSCSLSDITKMKHFFDLKASPEHFVCSPSAADCWEYMFLSSDSTLGAIAC